MLLWIGFAVLTAGVVAALLRPLLREDADAHGARDADVAVYRDQLAEIEADRERGLLAKGEAENARAEVARRLIEIEDQRTRAARAPAQRDRLSLGPIVRNATAVLVPLLAIGLYLNLGAPNLPGKPFVDPGKKPIELATQGELISMVEARLRDHPEDGRGWDVVAPAYMNEARFAESADAYARAIKLLGETPVRLKGLAEATILVNNGLVTEAARKAFARILEISPGNGEAEFGLALAKEQDGKLAAAADDYKRILDAAPANARWKPALEVRLARLMRGGGTPAPESADATGMNKEQRDQFILGMVERLAARLKAKGDDLPGWQQLVRSYKVLGREADATAALSEARRQFQGNDKALGDLDAFAKSIGMGS